MRALLAFTLVLLSAVVTPPALAQAVDGQISGVVVDATGQPLADQRVELRGPTRQGGTRLVTATDMNGQFAYARLRAGHYEVELRIEGRVIARSGPIELSERTMRVSGVTLALRPAPPPPPPARRRISADRLLRGQPVTDSFEALQSVLEPGYEVIVRDDAGGQTRGKVVSISGDQLVIARPRPFGRIITNPFRVEEQTFAENVVRRIEIVDSTLWPSAPAAVVVLAAGTMGAAYLCPSLGCIAWSSVAVAVSPVLVFKIDEIMNDPIYERQPGTPRITIAPMFGEGRKGVVAQISF